MKVRRSETFRTTRALLTELSGHDVRNRATKQFQAVAVLSSEHRWCLTGTPIQNTLEDLGAIVAFLKVPILENSPTFRKYITNQSTSTSKDRFLNLRKLLGAICLRRTRELLHLPEPVPHIQKLSFTPSEQAQYDDILLDCRRAIDIAISGNRRSRLNSTVLESLLKLRLFCNNGTANRDVQIGATGLPHDPDEALSYLQQNDQATCAYCSGPIYSINNANDTDGGVWMASCPHLVCRGCMPQHQGNKHHCPICTTNIDATLTSENFPQTLQSELQPQSQEQAQTQTQAYWQTLRATEPMAPHNGASPCFNTQYSSKLLAFLDDIKKQRSQKRYI
jgi:SWI/SNF-related matrix-associated actin-dependent regulator of chromatin subfamily A3